MLCLDEINAKSTCFVQDSCYDSGSDKSYENNDFWYSAEQKCFGCLCVEKKQYVVSFNIFIDLRLVK